MMSVIESGRADVTKRAKTDREKESKLKEAIAVAANDAVAGLPEMVKELGGTPDQGHAIAEATRVLLLRENGCEDRAKRILSAAGFVNGTIDFLLEMILTSIRKAV
jgi:hypothetical protein